MLREALAQRVETIDMFLLLFGCSFQINVYVYIIACVLKKKKRKERRKENNNKIKTRSTLIILINQNKLFFYIN